MEYGVWRAKLVAGAVKSFAGGIQFSLMGVMAESTIV